MPFTTQTNKVFGEIYLCQFPFTSGALSKLRPALVLFELQQDAVICRVTSVSHSGPLDIARKDWQQAGLLKPSVARLDRIVTAERKVFQRRLGILGPADLSAVKEAWNKQMRL
jgi:mRNA interferase MazF